MITREDMDPFKLKYLNTRKLK